MTTLVFGENHHYTFDELHQSIELFRREYPRTTRYLRGRGVNWWFDDPFWIAQFTILNCKWDTRGISRYLLLYLFEFHVVCQYLTETEKKVFYEEERQSGILAKYNISSEQLSK